MCAMLISEEQFLKNYGPLYERALQEARNYVVRPETLKAEVARQQQERDPMQIRTPEADPVAFRMTRYRGFVRFPDRLKNFIMAKHEPRSSTRSFLPTIMDVEPNSRCNFRCIMCQVSEWKNGKRAEDMTFEELKDFVEKQDGLTEVKLHGMGEPLMHKQYTDMVRFLAERDLWVRTNINGSLLHVHDNYRRLIDAGIGEIQTSVDGATKEVFETIRKKSNFERVVQNLTMLNDYANRQERPYTRMWVVVQEHNRHQIFDFVELAKQMGFRRLTFSVSLNDWGQEDWRAKNTGLQARRDLDAEELRRLAGMAVRDGINISVWKQADKYSTKSLETLCPWIFDRPYITSDMRVVPCCMIANPEITDLGDAKDFEHVWNGPAYRSFRQAHCDGAIPKECVGCYHKTE